MVLFLRNLNLSEVSLKEIYTTKRIKTHLNNALYQITAVYSEHEQESRLSGTLINYDDYKP